LFVRIGVKGLFSRQLIDFTGSHGKKQK